jgi:hypothetical protein
MRLVERFTIVDANTIRYEAKIEDPNGWAVLQRLLDVVLTLAKHRARFDPRRVNVGDVQGMEKPARYAACPALGFRARISPLRGSIQRGRPL